MEAINGIMYILFRSTSTPTQGTASVRWEGDRSGRQVRGFVSPLQQPFRFDREDRPHIVSKKSCLPIEYELRSTFGNLRDNHSSCHPVGLHYNVRHLAGSRPGRVRVGAEGWKGTAHGRAP